jgi:hypothetical protein
MMRNKKVNARRFIIYRAISYLCTCAKLWRELPHAQPPLCTSVCVQLASLYKMDQSAERALHIFFFYNIFWRGPWCWLQSKIARLVRLRVHFAVVHFERESTDRERALLRAKPRKNKGYLRSGAFRDQT